MISIISLLSACMASPDASVRERGDELIVAIGSEPDAGFDPTRGWGRYGSPLFQSTLLKRDDQLRIVHDLATGYSVSEDGLQWEIELREDVQFSDGQPLTAMDVVYTFQTAAASGSSIDLTNMENVEERDGAVVFTLKQPQSTFLYQLVATGIVPKHAHSDKYASEPIGSGPFLLRQWDRGQQLIVEANPLYYGERPIFNKLTFLFLNEDAAFAAAKAGEVDMAYIPSTFSKQPVEGMHLIALQTVDNRGIAFPYVQSGEVTEEGIAVGNDVTADSSIRKAMNVVIDRHALVDGILEGHGTPAYSSVDGLPWWNPDTVIQDGDAEEAKRILVAGGWSDSDGDGIMEKDGLKAEFSLLYPAGDATRQSLALAAADMALQAGIEIHVDGKSWDELESAMHANAVLFGWGSHDPLELYALHASENSGVAYYNTGYYGNPAVDDWMTKALEATTEEEAMSYWKKAQWDGETGFSALGDAPWAWLVNIEHLYLVRDDLDIGSPHIQPHGHGWPVTDNIVQWKWTD
ncbi:ABC transporter substrate-binding protein [Paenibacillus chungangensis]|uniref:ABC transporter substrate-binding protein n=1 Tax=Paenibacillus chungangensis TaxID=696535 RepID=A0ABW3HYA1_9BACL